MTEDTTTRNETTGNRHQPARHNLIGGLNAWKGRVPARAALTLKTAPPNRTAKAVNRSVSVEGPPDTGKATLVRGLAAPLSALAGSPVGIVEFSAHKAISGTHRRSQPGALRAGRRARPTAAEATMLAVDGVEGSDLLGAHAQATAFGDRFLEMSVKDTDIT